MKNIITLREYKDYFKDIIMLELQCYKLNYLKKSLVRKYNIIESNIKALNNEILYLKNYNYRKTNSREILLGELIGFICGDLIILVCLLFDAFTSFDVFNSLSSFLFFSFFIIFISIFIPIKYHISQSKNRSKENKERINNIKIEISESENLILYYQNEYDTCISQYNQTIQILNNYYSIDLIYPKYRGLIPVTTIYEYFDSGRCSTLKGHEGAYNLYESELRMNLIIDKLDEVIRRLDDISSNQHLLVQELKKAKSQIDNISSSLDDLNNNSALIQYHNSVIASNVAYLAEAEKWNNWFK